MTNFKRVIEQRKQEAAAKPPPRDPSLMSERELNREKERLEKELRSSTEEWVRAARSERSTITTPQARPVFLPKRSRRRPWK